MNNEILGIDIGNVITAGSNEIFTPNFLNGPAMPGAFEAIARLVSEKFGREHVWLVSKCGKKTEDRTKEWLEHHRFYELTGVAKGHVLFCRKREEKAPICKNLGITHFIDDRYEVLQYIAFANPLAKLYAFQPRPEEIRQFWSQVIDHQIISVASWQEICHILLPKKDFSRFLVKENEKWNVYLHENQGYLGRCYLWCKREAVQSLVHINDSEYVELQHLLTVLQAMIVENFGATKINHAFLGNTTPHLHCHLIPRYTRAVNFLDTTFTDERWGQNYQTDPQFITPPRIMEELLRIFREYLR